MKPTDKLAIAMGVVLAAEVASATGRLWICVQAPALKATPACAATVGVLTETASRIATLLRSVSQAPDAPSRDALPYPTRPSMPLAP